MPTWIALVLLVGGAVTLFMMFLGVQALWYRKLRLLEGGRTVYGPLAQFCGLLALAPLVLSVISCGEMAYLIGLRPDPAPARNKLSELWERPRGTEPDDAERNQEIRAAAKQVLYSWAGDFALFGIVLDLLVWALVDFCGVRPVRRLRKTVDAHGRES